MAFILLCWMGAILVQQNDQLRKDLKDAYHKLNQLKK
jgi:cell division protein FtsB